MSSITPGERLSFLQQDQYKYDEYLVLDTVIMGNARLYEIMKEKEVIYAKEDFTDEDGIRASELEAEFATMNGWEAESDAASLLNGLGIETELHVKYDKRPDRTGKGQSASGSGSFRQSGYSASGRADQPPGPGCHCMAGRISHQL